MITPTNLFIVHSHTQGGLFVNTTGHTRCSKHSEQAPRSGSGFGLLAAEHSKPPRTSSNQHESTKMLRPVLRILFCHCRDLRLGGEVEIYTSHHHHHHHRHQHHDRQCDLKLWSGFVLFTLPAISTGGDQLIMRNGKTGNSVCHRGWGFMIGISPEHDEGIKRSFICDCRTFGR